MGRGEFGGKGKEESLSRRRESAEKTLQREGRQDRD